MPPSGSQRRVTLVRRRSFQAAATHCVSTHVINQQLAEAAEIFAERVEDVA
jgi:hypothetical protein